MMAIEDARNGNPSEVRPFPYPAGPNAAIKLWEDIPEIVSSSPSDHFFIDRQDSIRNEGEDDPSSQPSQDTIRSFEAGREQGIVEGREQEKKEQSGALLEHEKKLIEHVAKLTSELTRDRTAFLLAAEQEVVKLSLTIAARILRREAQMDPLFLIGAVRVALGQLADTVQVRLRIPSPEAQLWTETLAHIPNLKKIPTVVPDAGMHLGDCLIETEMGSADLGLRAQLQETEGILLGNQQATA